MSEVKHTPGPWRVEQGTTLVWGNCNPDDHSTRGMGYPIADARINPSGNWSTGPYADEGEANARLIAAAPEMLEALKSARAVIQEDRDEIFDSVTVAGDESTMDDIDRPSVERMDAVLREIDAAIAKATGSAK